MPAMESELVLRSDDPRLQQVEADGWEQVASSWGARFVVTPSDEGRLPSS